MRILSIVLTTAILLTPPAAGNEELPLEYPRFEKIRESRDVSPEPLPEALRIRPAGGPEKPPPAHDAAAIDRRAKRSAAATVAHAARAAATGRFEVGFWQGLRRALDDPYLGEDARAAGFRDGHYHPEAAALGWDLGRDAAERRAAELAAAEIEARFRDLSREPAPSFRTPRVEPSPSLPRLAPPTLRGVFETTPWGGSHRLDPWRLYRRDSYRDLYRGRWIDPEHGFRHWEKQQRRGSYWQGLNPDEKGRFRDVFNYEYAVAMAGRRPELRRAHRRGFHDGWHHGTRLQAEWSYRRGYHEGYELALSEASRRGFHETFAPRYDAVYRRLFDEWSTRPRPEILGVWLADANDDGVFEPGEEVLARWEIANYGGAGAELPLVYGSGVTPGVAEVRVELPRRRVVRSERALRLRVAEGTAPRTDAAVFVELAGDSFEAPFRVAHPLELEAPVRLLAHDVVSGRATLAVGLVNNSRRQVPAAAALRLAGGRTVAPDEPIAALDPGSRLRLRFEADGLAPLELLAGETRFVVEARSRGKLHDELTYRPPVLATRLEDPALVDYLLALARGGGSRTEVARAHELTLERLRADWGRAVEAGGNPYRRDRKKGTAETALGDLVSTFRDHRASFAEPRVFTDLEPRIEALAADLPGAHPFLRAQMKKLARQLG